jgi:phosphoribosylaminoimidazole-succinocarboxamide synthase
MFNNIADVINDFKSGKIIIVTDNENRENEGDLVCAGDFCTPEKINFFITHGKGLVCMPISSKVAKRLSFTKMVADGKNRSKFETPFMTSIGAKQGITTGISAFDRSFTICLVANNESTADDFSLPGHVFPLLAKDGGLKEREGHTEACVDLCKFTGLSEVATLCEIIKEDGTMARRDYLFEFAKKHGLKITSVEAIKNYIHKSHKSDISNEIDFFGIAKIQKLYSGKAKDIFQSSVEGLVIQYFKDDVTAGNGARHEVLKDKGIINCAISSHIMQYLKEQGIENHFVRQLNSREQLVKKIKIIPLEVIVRNKASGSFVKRFGTKEGFIFDKPCVEFSYKDDSLGDPAISEGQIESLKIALPIQIAVIKEIAMRVNIVLKHLFEVSGLILIDFKIELGFDEEESIILADEISPDSCRIVSIRDGRILDKDVFRKNLGDITKTYKEIADAIGVKSLDYDN